MPYASTSPSTIYNVTNPLTTTGSATYLHGQRSLGQPPPLPPPPTPYYDVTTPYDVTTVEATASAVQRVMANMRKALEVSSEKVLPGFINIWAEVGEH